MKTERELKKIFGKNVSTRRAARGWTQEELAAKVGVSKNTISDVEAGHKFARAKTLVNLAKVFETEAYELLKPDGVLPDTSADIIAKYSEEVRENVEKISQDYMRKVKP